MSDQMLVCKLEEVIECIRQETEQLCFIVVNSEEVGPVDGDGCTAYHPSSDLYLAWLLL